MAPIRSRFPLLSLAVFLAVAVTASAQETPASPPAAAPAHETAQDAATPEPPPPPPQDVLIFGDGDQLKGEFIHVENGDLVFQSPKAGQLHTDLGRVEDMTTHRIFAVIKTGQKVIEANAVVGAIKLHEGDLTITPANAPPVVMKAFDVGYILDDAEFEREVRHKFRLHDGWSQSLSLGGSIMRSTDNGSALDVSANLNRTLPQAYYLPRRNRTEFGIRESYQTTRSPDTGFGTYQSKSNVFHADAEREENVHKQLYLMFDYTFDRDYAQGLLGQNLYGIGVGYTVVKSYDTTVDIKTDFHRENQDFNDDTRDDVLWGQKFQLVAEHQFPKGYSLQTDTDYLAAYNRPHDYEADTVTSLTIPMFWRIGIQIALTDNYINNALPGYKRNSLRVSTSINIH
jgi:hypothetical protein